MPRENWRHIERVLGRWTTSDDLTRTDEEAIAAVLNTAEAPDDVTVIRYCTGLRQRVEWKRDGGEWERC